MERCSEFYDINSLVISYPEFGIVLVNEWNTTTSSQSIAALESDK